MKIKVTLAGDILTLDPREKEKKRDGKSEHNITWQRSKTSESFSWDCVHFDDPKAPIKVKPFDPDDKKIKAIDTIKKKSGDHTWTYYICVSNAKGDRICNNDQVAAGGGRGVIRNRS